MTKNVFIETVSGTFINLTDPKPEQINLQDIAWALSRMPRYAGHTLSEVPYSVAQHSCLCLQYAEELIKGSDPDLFGTFRDLAARDAEELLPTIEGLNLQRVVKPHMLLHVLLHDASEAYLLDVPTPLKKLPGINEAYGAIESRMMQAIWQRFELAPPNTFTQHLVAWADCMALSVEAYHLMKSRGSGWSKIFDLPIHVLQRQVIPVQPMDAYTRFIAVFNSLNG